MANIKLSDTMTEALRYLAAGEYRAHLEPERRTLEALERRGVIRWSAEAELGSVGVRRVHDSTKLWTVTSEGWSWLKENEGIERPADEAVDETPETVDAPVMTVSPAMRGMLERAARTGGALGTVYGNINTVVALLTRGLVTAGPHNVISAAGWAWLKANAGIDRRHLADLGRLTEAEALEDVTLVDVHRDGPVVPISETEYAACLESWARHGTTPSPDYNDYAAVALLRGDLERVETPRGSWGIAVSYTVKPLDAVALLRRDADVALREADSALHEADSALREAGVNSTDDVLDMREAIDRVTDEGRLTEAEALKAADRMRRPLGNTFLPGGVVAKWPTPDLTETRYTGRVVAEETGAVVASFESFAGRKVERMRVVVPAGWRAPRLGDLVAVNGLGHLPGEVYNDHPLFPRQEIRVTEDTAGTVPEKDPADEPIPYRLLTDEQRAVKAEAKRDLYSEVVLISTEAGSGAGGAQQDEDRDDMYSDLDAWRAGGGPDRLKEFERTFRSALDDFSRKLDEIIELSLPKIDRINGALGPVLAGSVVRPFHCPTCRAPFWSASVRDLHVSRHHV